MKNSINVVITTLITFMMPGLGLKAQNTKPASGIYLTEQDYKSNKLNYILTGNDKIHLNAFLNGKNVTLIYHDKKITLPKSSTYGFRLDNQDYRFFNNTSYKILDTAGFMLYTYQTLTQQGKGYKPADEYAYSKTTSEPVLELTIENLWKSFPAKEGFRFSLKNYFSDGADLATYDRQSGQYKIKYFYFQHPQPVTARVN